MQASPAARPPILRLDEDRILVEQLRLLLQNIKGSLLPAFLIAVLLVWTLDNDTNRIALHLWCANLMLVKLFCAWDARRTLIQGIAPERARRVALRQILLNALNAVSWSSLAWVAMGTVGSVGRIFVMTILATVVSSAMSQLSPVLPVFVVFMAFELGTLTAAMVHLGDPAYNALAVAAGIYFVLQVGQARNSTKATRASIELRFQNLELIEQLTDEKARAEAADRAKSVFLAAVSHDLRQPTHALGLFIHSLQNYASGIRLPAPEQMRELAASMRASLSALSGLLHGILNISLLDSGAIQTNVKSVSINEILQRMEQRYAADAASKGLSFRCLPTRHWGLTDEMVLERMLSNLIENAIRYTEYGRILVGCRRSEDTLTLSVYDTGIGIPEAVRESVFDEFFQVGNLARRREHGIGLGLAIVKRSAQLLGHGIGLESELGRGSHFSLSLPAVAPAPDAMAIRPSADTIPQPAAPRQRPTVVVVDDDRSILAAMTTLLEEEGFGVIACTVVDEIDADLRAHRESVRLILADFRLADNVTGDQAIADVQRRLGRDVPAMLITGDTSPERIREASRSGFRLLHKPIEVEELFAAIDDMLVA